MPASLLMKEVNCTWPAITAERTAPSTSQNAPRTSAANLACTSCPRFQMRQWRAPETNDQAAER
jgi:hypothetical protein